MPDYRRFYLNQPVFVTLVTHNRQPWLADQGAEAVLAAMRKVKAQYPLRNIAHVVLPDHLHWLFETDENTDFSQRVAAVKREFTWRMKEQGLSGPFWQARFYDHLIRDEADLRKHLDYIHFNPVRHGHCAKAADWPWSSFPAWLERGGYPHHWGEVAPADLAEMDLE